MDRSKIVHDALLTRSRAGDLPKGAPPTPGLLPEAARTLFLAQAQSRALDLAGRAMQARGEGFYTIGSSGHEGMAAVAWALRPTDPALLHYRDGAFQLARAAQVPERDRDMVWDMLLSFACSSEDPISGGRHKVLGAADLAIPPQTSTIASHLPKAMGLAFGIGAARRRAPEHASLPKDALVMVSFGDASLNHSTAQGTINAAGWTATQGSPLPLLMVCEDNGIGISTKTPTGWVRASLEHRTGLRYFAANGLDLTETYAVTKEAADWVRRHRKPAVLHLRTVRLYGHAGADIATSYLPRAEVEADEANDPLLHSMRLLQDMGALSAADAGTLYEKTHAEILARSVEAGQRPSLETAAEVAAALIPPRRSCTPSNGPSAEARAEVFGSDLAAQSQPQPMNRHLQWALTDLMLEHGAITLMGEDIGRKGGVYGITQKLQSRFGADRVIDTLLDEQSILGLALGMAQAGFLPIPEIQFLAYLHNAEDQLRGEAATLPFFSQGQFTNPMVLRIAGLGYQKGFGGHFHNDNSLAVLRDIPGLMIACPSNGPDAARMLRSAVRLAREEQRIVAFVEPIALYPMRDLHEAGDGGWMGLYPSPSEQLEPGHVTTYGTGTDIAFVTYGNGVYLSRQAQRTLAGKGIESTVIDLHWLAPLAETAILDAAAGARHVVIVDECRRTGSQSEALMTLFTEAGRGDQVSRVVAEDCFIATGRAYAAPLPSAEAIVDAARAALKG